MGRHANPNMTKEWKIHIDATTAGRVEFRLLDPLTSKPRYGSRGELVNELLKRWLDENPDMPEPEKTDARSEH